jgi:SWI/SNF-related matrix-associated actin-dependent regulator of chromatin subfamily A3
MLPPTFVKIHILDNAHLNYDDGSVFLINDLSTIGQLRMRTVEILRELHTIPKISIQIRCVVSRVDSQRPKKKDEGLFEIRATLSAIIYGPYFLYNKVGDFFEDYDIYLQDPPGGCDRNVRYRNPHKLSGLDDDAPMTIDRNLTAPDDNRINQELSTGHLDDLNFNGDLAEADIPSALRTSLHKHQRQGLYFMRMRERGWCVDNGLKDIWKTTKICGVTMYWNTINDDVQEEAPEGFRGGLLLDDMGLGKTLTAISLIASDSESCGNIGTTAWPGAFSTCHQGTQCTLVIVPPPLLRIWEEQLSTHLHPGRIRWRKHHGSHRLSQLSQITGFNVVLTTYNIVASEAKISSVLFQARWHRIILDEAQEVRDPHTQTAKAICALKADRRWAITGAPIQNHLTDFHALLQFLGAHPYHKPTAFARDITNIWQTDPEAAVRRLMRIITSLGLRRSRKSLDLPERVHQDTFLTFSPMELELYESLESNVMSILNQARMPNDTSTQQNALKGLNALRLVCNFGTLSDSKHFRSSATLNEGWGEAEAQELFDSLLTAGNTSCCKCSTNIASTSGPNDDWSSVPAFDVLGKESAVSECAKYLCGTCNLEAQRNDESSLGWCGHSPPCATQTIKINNPPSYLNTTPIDQLSLGEYPTKIRALINDLKAFPTAKSVVFSAWRTTLDLCDRALSLASIPFVRFDGKVNEHDRTDALSRFSSDPEIKVILFTISCGAVGLDLTAANRAYLLEPQWNPTIEDQAFARIHRMGQQRPVTTVRFLMKDSYEEEVINVQKQKSNFASLLLSGKRSKGTKAGHGDVSVAYETVKRLVGRR